MFFLAFRKAERVTILGLILVGLMTGGALSVVAIISRASLGAAVANYAVVGSFCGLCIERLFPPKRYPTKLIPDISFWQRHEPRSHLKRGLAAHLYR